MLQQHYYPYGGIRNTDNPATDIGYTGQRLDASTGLMHYQARYYDPVIGRFISPDTIIPKRTNPQDFNRYAYVQNNPATHTDPTGHCNSCQTGFVIEGGYRGGPTSVMVAVALREQVRRGQVAEAAAEPPVPEPVVEPADVPFCGNSGSGSVCVDERTNSNLDDVLVTPDGLRFPTPACEAGSSMSCAEQGRLENGGDFDPTLYDIVEGVGDIAATGQYPATAVAAYICGPCSVGVFGTFGTVSLVADGATYALDTFEVAGGDSLNLDESGPELAQGGFVRGVGLLGERLSGRVGGPIAETLVNLTIWTTPAAE